MVYSCLNFNFLILDKFKGLPPGDVCLTAVTSNDLPGCLYCRSALLSSFGLVRKKNILDFASVILLDLEVNKPDLNSLDAVIDIKEKSYEIIS